jgi:ferritin
MLKKKIEKAFNKQINAELYSSYLYLSMAACFNAKNLPGMAQWMRVQADEEREHAMKFFHFIEERGGRVELAAIEAPQKEWKTALEAFEAAYEHETKVTGMINDLVDLSISEKDHASNAFLQWFVTEQVEEEANAQGIVDQLKMVGDKGNGLFMVDRELGKRQPGAEEEGGE